MPGEPGRHREARQLFEAEQIAVEADRALEVGGREAGVVDALDHARTSAGLAPARRVSASVVRRGAGGEAKSGISQPAGIAARTSARRAQTSRDSMRRQAVPERSRPHGRVRDRRRRRGHARHRRHEQIKGVEARKRRGQQPIGEGVTADAEVDLDHEGATLRVDPEREAHETAALGTRPRECGKRSVDLDGIGSMDRRHAWTPEIRPSGSTATHSSQSAIRRAEPRSSSARTETSAPSIHSETSTEPFADAAAASIRAAAKSAGDATRRIPALPRIVTSGRRQTARSMKSTSRSGSNRRGVRSPARRHSSPSARLLVDASTSPAPGAARPCRSESRREESSAPASVTRATTPHNASPATARRIVS